MCMIILYVSPPYMNAMNNKYIHNFLLLEVDNLESGTQFLIRWFCAQRVNSERATSYWKGRNLGLGDSLWVRPTNDAALIDLTLIMPEE